MFFPSVKSLLLKEINIAWSPFFRLPELKKSTELNKIAASAKLFLWLWKGALLPQAKRPLI